ncbi:hypothetical protein, partial [Shigella sp. FC1544]
IICTPMTSLKTSIKTITYLSDTGCLEIQGASLKIHRCIRLIKFTFYLLGALLVVVAGGIYALQMKGKSGVKLVVAKEIH